MSEPTIPTDGGETPAPQTSTPKPRPTKASRPRSTVRIPRQGAKPASTADAYQLGRRVWPD